MKKSYKKGVNGSTTISIEISQSRYKSAAWLCCADATARQSQIALYSIKSAECCPDGRPPLGDGLDQYPSMGRFRKPPFVAMGDLGSSWWRDERTSTHPLWIKARDGISPHE
ncbi:hypothetical protein XU18_3486 [Perkinsela sp. CCAP 1560/4]|nr:hypothetical protein XU18_3486 [Perkinsela sp. CCAP 1560/4]|eukprot:KNH05515.1 hypothetical protein XU18_3486 [Perkinsela sp. CCAP 1560/4]